MPNVLFPDIVIEKKYESVLDTKLDLQQFMTVDRSLTENSGMKKKVVTKSVVGDVEDLAMGEGNTGYVEVTTETKDYDVGVTQGRFAYYDEEAMQDDKVVEAGLTGLAEIMVNDFTSKSVAEWNKANLIKYGATWTYDNIVDAIAMMNLEAEDGLFILINPAQQAAFRKNLKDDLKYVEANVRTGYIGQVCGASLFISKAIPVGKAFLATKKAVTLFIKKGIGRELEREPNTRKTTEYIRKVALVALTDATKVVKLSAGADPRTGYTVLTEAPVDWATDYTDYFTYDSENEKMVAVTGAAAPTFVANKYWAANN